MVFLATVPTTVEVQFVLRCLAVVAFMVLLRISLISGHAKGLLSRPVARVAILG
jgi:hypothetical protein